MCYVEVACEVNTDFLDGAALEAWEQRLANRIARLPEDVPRLFLGYDVADWYLLSSLANCGLGEDPALRDRWSSRVNDWHLFESSMDANEFRSVSEREVPEHAPFFAYGIWALNGTERNLLLGRAVGVGGE
jgi:hypothetical protein